MILEQILEPAARDRLVRLGLVRPDKCKAVEDNLIKMATSGGLRGKVIFLRLIALFLLIPLSRLLKRN